MSQAQIITNVPKRFQSTNSVIDRNEIEEAILMKIWKQKIANDRKSRDPKEFREKVNLLNTSLSSQW